MRGCRALMVTVIILGSLFAIQMIPMGAGAQDSTDLVVSDMHVSPKDVRKGGSVEMSAMVSNIGGERIENVTVNFYDGTRVIKKMTIDALDPGGSEEVNTIWDTGNADIGRHMLRIVVDPGDRIPETDEANNEVSQKVEVSEAAGMVYAIPILILIAVLGILSFKLRNWVLLKRLERKRREEEGEFEVLEEE